METSSHEVHETSLGRDDRHHFAELQQVATAGDDEVGLLEAVRLHSEQFLEVTRREGEGVCFRESAARFECSLEECLSARQMHETKGTHPGKVEPRVPGIPNFLDAQPNRDVILSEQSDGAFLRQRWPGETRKRWSARAVSTVHTTKEHAHPPLLPVVRERPRGREDHANVRLTELLREQVRLRPTDDGELQRRVELRLDFSLERQDGRDNVRAASLDDQRDFSLYPPRQFQLPRTLDVTQQRGRDVPS